MSELSHSLSLDNSNIPPHLILILLHCIHFAARSFPLLSTHRTHTTSSMDLSALGSSLPPGLADAERDMGDKFRGMSRAHRSHHLAARGVAIVVLDDVADACPSQPPR